MIQQNRIYKLNIGEGVVLDAKVIGVKGGFVFFQTDYFSSGETKYLPENVFQECIVK